MLQTVGVLVSFVFVAINVDRKNRRKREERVARLSLLAEQEAAKSELASAREKASRAQDRRAAVAERLDAARCEVEAFGTPDDRKHVLAASDQASTLAAECEWYRGQAAAAMEALEEHATHESELSELELPNLRAQVGGLEAALKDAEAETHRAESNRQSVDSSAEQLQKEVDQLRTLFRGQKEELQRLERETQELQDAADEAKHEMYAETDRQLKMLGREVTMEERLIRWTKGEKRATEAGNEVLRAAVADKDSEKEQIESLLASAGKTWDSLEQELEGAHKELIELEEVARTRDRQEKDAARQRERHEKMQTSLDDLKHLLQEAKENRKLAEEAENQAKAIAKQRCHEAQSLENEVNSKCTHFGSELQGAIDKHNAAVDEARSVHAALCQMAQKAEALHGRLVEAEEEKVRLRMELQKIADTQIDEDFG